MTVQVYRYVLFLLALPQSVYDPILLMICMHGLAPVVADLFTVTSLPVLSCSSFYDSVVNFLLFLASFLIIGFSNHLSPPSLFLFQVREKSNNEKAGISLVDLAYRRAKAVKAVKRATDAGKIMRRVEKKSKHPAQKTQTRTEEMRELFQNDMSDRKPKRNPRGGKKKSSFKSKSRYESYHVPHYYVILT